MVSKGDVTEDELKIKRVEMETHDNSDEEAPSWQDEMDRSQVRHLNRYGPTGEFFRLLEDEVETGRVLDYCCGSNPRAPQSQHADQLDIVGIDLSKTQLKTASDEFDGEYFVGDGEYLPFETDSFDAVVASLALHHLPHWDTKALDEISRVLVDDGVLIFREPLRYNPFAAVFRMITDTQCRTPYETPLPPRKLKRLLGENFEELETKGHYIVAPAFTFLSKLLPKRIPTSIIESIYDTERFFLDRGVEPIAVAMTGVARNPI